MLGTLPVELIRLAVWLALLAAIFVTVERLFPRHPRAVLRPGFLQDLGYYFLSSLVPSVLLGVPLAAIALAAEHVVPAAVRGWISALPLPGRLALAMLVGELGFYWGHRLSHEIPLLWRFHAVHHSAEHMDWLVNTRAHPVDLVFTRLCGLVPMAALGLAAPLTRDGTLAPALLIVAGTLWGFFIHANLRWRFGPLERVVATPAFHHWHHTRTEFRDRNYASMFSWLDRLFGTFHLPGSWPAEYGTDTEVGATIPAQLARPFVASRPQSGTTSWSSSTDRRTPSSGESSMSSCSMESTSS